MQMTFRPRMAVLLLSLAYSFISMVPTPARAQVKYTISPFLGVRFGGRIILNTPTVDYLPIDKSLNWGFNAGVRVAPNLFGEFTWNRQTTTLSAHDVLTNKVTTLTTKAHLDMYHDGGGLILRQAFKNTHESESPTTPLTVATNPY